jgi:DNA polymerase III subunit gamma/tau
MKAARAPAGEGAAARHQPAGASEPLRDVANESAPKGGPTATSPSDGPESWSAIVGQLELGGAARQLASHCLLVSRQGAVVRLGLDPRNKHMRTPAQEEKLAQALVRHFGQPVRLEFENAAAGSQTPAQAEQRASLEDIDTARRAFEADPGVQGLRERFGATLLPETVRPLK